jgi:hypothetical protein
LLRGQVVIVGVVWPSLGDFPVLTKLTIEIAPHGGNRERSTSGKDMIKGLLFYGIHMHCTGITVNQGIVTTIYVFPYFTIAPFTLLHFAEVGAKLTAYSTIFKGSEKRGKLAAQVTFLQAQSLGMRGRRHQNNGLQGQTQDGAAAALSQEISPTNPLCHLLKTVKIVQVVEVV